MYKIMKRIKFTLLIIFLLFKVEISYSQVSNTVNDSIIRLMDNKINLLEERINQKLNNYDNRNNFLIDKNKDSISYLIKEILILKKLNEEINILNNNIENLKFSDSNINDRIGNISNTLNKTGNDISNLRGKDLEVDSVNNLLNNKLIAVINLLDERGIKIKGIEESISKKQFFSIIIIVIILLLLIVVYLILEKRRKSDTELLLARNKEIFEKQIEDSQKIVDWFEKESEASLNVDDSKGADADHSFALRVTDEIVKINSNLSRMDENVKGHKQLKRSSEKLGISLNSNGYEIVDMINESYKETMNVIATFIEDENLDENEQIITRIIKPQVNYKGKMIQAAQVEVSQGI